MGGEPSKSQSTEAQLDSDCSDQQSQEQVDEHVPCEFHGDNSLADVKVEPLTNSLATNGTSFRPKHRFQPIRDYVRGGAPLIEDLVLELKEVNWYKLGIQLRVPQDRLDKIEEDYHSADRRLSEVLKYWLVNEKDLSWNKICEALGRIGEYGNIVREIKMKYCSIDELRTFTRCRRYYESKPADSEENVDLQLSCEVNPRIDAAITDLQEDFRDCVNAIRLTFTNTVSAIKELLQSELPAGEVKGQVGLLLIQSANMRAIKESADIDQLFMTLSNIHAWDFLHPQLLEYLIQALKIDEAQEHMRKYKSTLTRFRETTKMSELSGWFGNFPRNSLLQKVVLRLGDGWEDKTYQQFEEVRVSILRQQVFDKSLLSFGGALSGSILVALFTPCDINVAALEQALKSPSLSAFMRDNEISAVYAKGICLIRDVGPIQESLTTPNESEDFILTESDTEITTDPTVNKINPGFPQTDLSEKKVVSTIPCLHSAEPMYYVQDLTSMNIMPSHLKSEVFTSLEGDDFSEESIEKCYDTSSEEIFSTCTAVQETASIHTHSQSLPISLGELLTRNDSLERYYQQRVEDLEEQLQSLRKEFTEFRAASEETVKKLEERMKKLEQMLEQALALKS